MFVESFGHPRSDGPNEDQRQKRNDLLGIPQYEFQVGEPDRQRTKDSGNPWG